MHVSILSCYCLGQVCCIVAYVWLREVPMVRLMFLMFLVRTRNLCMNQNAYKTSGAERESIPFKLAHTTISNGHKQIDDASLFSGGEMNTFSSVCFLQVVISFMLYKLMFGWVSLACFAEEESSYSPIQYQAIKGKLIFTKKLKLTSNGKLVRSSTLSQNTLETKW